MDLTKNVLKSLLFLCINKIYYVIGNLVTNTNPSCRTMSFTPFLLAVGLAFGKTHWSWNEKTLVLMTAGPSTSHMFQRKSSFLQGLCRLCFKENDKMCSGCWKQGSICGLKMHDYLGSILSLWDMTSVIHSISLSFGVRIEGPTILLTG